MDYKPYFGQYDKAPRVVIQDPRLKGILLDVWIAFLSHSMNDDHLSFVGLEKIAEYTGRPWRKVLEARRDLSKLGFMKTKRRYDNSSWTQLTIPDVSDAELEWQSRNTLIPWSLSRYPMFGITDKTILAGLLSLNKASILPTVKPKGGLDTLVKVTGYSLSQVKRALGSLASHDRICFDSRRGHSPSYFLPPGFYAAKEYFEFADDGFDLTDQKGQNAYIRAIRESSFPVLSNDRESSFPVHEKGQNTEVIHSTIQLLNQEKSRPRNGDGQHTELKHWQRTRDERGRFTSNGGGPMAEPTNGNGRLHTRASLDALPVIEAYDGNWISDSQLAAENEALANF